MNLLKTELINISTSYSLIDFKNKKLGNKISVCFNLITHSLRKKYNNNTNDNINEEKDKIYFLLSGETSGIL